MAVFTCTECGTPLETVCPPHVTSYTVERCPHGCAQDPTGCGLAAPLPQPVIGPRASDDPEWMAWETEYLAARRLP